MIRQEGVDVMSCNYAVENEIKVSRVVTYGDSDSVCFEVSGRTPKVRTKVELETFLEELRDTILGSFRLD